MIQPATEKQLSYLDSLKREAIRPPADKYVGQRGIAKRTLETALALRLPAPADSRDAAAQIDALKTGVVGYYETRRDAYLAVATKLAAKAGRDGAGIRSDLLEDGVTDAERAEQRAAWVAYVESLLA